MIKNLLIANRGEIAVRIAQTAKRLGVATYAIRTEKEPSAVYLSKADHILDFKGPNKKESEFLDIEAIIKMAKDNGIESIHPGYGYLSENALFAQRCKEEGIMFIGPSADVIRAMGDKITAKDYAEKSGVPLLKGSKTCVKTSKEALHIAHEIGYPVIIKAAAGGGGRGMRIVNKKSEMEPMFKMASTEAQNAFNDPSVFVEKYLENPRHIEIQIVADNFGNVVHLGERECSIQRKHQKLLEEAPSSALNEKLRDEMTKSAIALAKAVNYQSLGTVEFLLDKNGHFYFMEMNTRIQVEHPITEMITGLDLVELQLRIASDEKLPISQKDVKLKGWAIECRINAEDVQSNFAPCTGTIRNLRLPKGENIRIDTGVAPGSEITPWFDSMIAKLIVHGETREKAINLSMSALRQFYVKGIKTTIPFCKAVLTEKHFRSGSFDTSFIESRLKSPVFHEENEELLAALLAISTYSQETTPETSSETAINPWVLNRRIRQL